MASICGKSQAKLSFVLLSSALLVLLLEPQGAQSMVMARSRRSVDSGSNSNLLELPANALAVFSRAGTRRLQHEYVAGYNEVKAAKEEVEALVIPCKERVAEVAAEIREQCLPCIIDRCTSRAQDCEIESTPVSAPSCDALRSAPDNQAIGRLCSHYLRACPRTSYNQSIACAKQRCVDKIATCDPCDDGFVNSALCETVRFGLDVRTFFDTDIPSFFEDDIGGFFQDDVQDFITDDVANFFTEDVEGFFTDTISEGFLDTSQDAGEFFEGAFDSAGDFFSGAFDDTSDFFGAGFDELEGFGDSLEGVFNDAFSDIGDAFGDLGDVFGDLGGSLGDVFGDIGGGFESVGSDIGGGFEDVGSSVGSSLSDVFGKRRRRSVPGEANCALIADSEARQGECIKSYRRTCGARCQYATDTGIDLPTVCPEMTSKNVTYTAALESNRWILQIPKADVRMTFASFVLNKSDVDADQLYGAVGVATVRDTTFTFNTRSGATRQTFRDQLPNVIQDAIAAYRAATGDA